MEQVYKYLTGMKFRQRVEAVIEKFNDMRDDIDRERKFMGKQWSKREAQILAVVARSMILRTTTGSFFIKASMGIDATTLVQADIDMYEGKKFASSGARHRLGLCTSGRVARSRSSFFELVRPVNASGRVIL